MKTQISALELHYLLAELQPIVGAKVNKVYQPGAKELLLHLHHASKGKLSLRILVPNILYLCSEKQDNPERPPGFCMLLRKLLDNARLKAITQIGFERIASFTLETREGQIELVVELFNKGNIILVKEGTILGVMEQQNWSDRTLKKGEKYQYPTTKYNILTLTEAELSELFATTDQDSLVKCLAHDLGLGGFYAEEACFRAGVDKKISPKTANTKKLITALHALTHAQPAPAVYRTGNKLEILPFAPVQPVSEDMQPMPSFNEAIDQIFSQLLVQEKSTTQNKTYTTKINKWQTMITEQEQQVEKLKQQAECYTEQGEKIYKNYKLLADILSQLNAARAKHTLLGIKEKLKGHKLIKEVNAKDKSVVVEIQ
ncbi:NFACT family protein [Candidatus Woesearchaeota archaeon]|nr:NFACT family protein [Candidatus Woesearchaeota archaeon]